MDKILPKEVYSINFIKKYKHPGIYCIKVNNKVLYIGQSHLMSDRVRSHMRKILNPPQLPCKQEYMKYQWLSQFHKEGKLIEFDVLFYTSQKETRTEREKEEAFFINKYLPPLNLVIPNHPDFPTKPSKKFLQFSSTQEILSKA